MDAKEIANNSYYTIHVDPPRNRAYLKIIGFWKGVDVVPNYLNDWTKAMTYMNRGFTLLTDASEMKTHPQDVKELHAQAQRPVSKKNISKVAEVIKTDMAEMQLNNVAKQTQFPKQNFKTRMAAERWLDED